MASQCLAPDVYVRLLDRVWCEPATVITDVLLAIQLLWYAARSRGKARAWFALMALAFALGGARHLLHHELLELVPAFSRLQNIAGSAALGLLASLLALGNGARRQRRAEWIYGLVAGGFILAHVALDHFLLTVAHQALALLGATAVVLLQGRARSYLPFLGHVALGLVCAAVFALRLAPHPWFDQGAVAHLLMLPAFALMAAQLRRVGWSSGRD